MARRRLLPMGALIPAVLALAVALVLLWGAGGSEAGGATLTVTSTGDGTDINLADGVCDDGKGNCTLRAAIEQANANAGTDPIAFNIPGTGLHTIQPASALPTITDPVIIDGYTQPGASPNTNGPGLGTNAVLKIELDGTNAGTGPSSPSEKHGWRVLGGMMGPVQ